jgi:hypothetical protein
VWSPAVEVVAIQKPAQMAVATEQAAPVWILAEIRAAKQAAWPLVLALASSTKRPLLPARVVSSAKMLSVPVWSR